MKLSIFAIFVFLFSISSAFSKTKIYLSKSVFDKEAYSTIYKDQGALVRMVNYDAVNELIPQLEKLYDVKLDDRKEAHITTVTPPEYDGRFNKNEVGLHDVFDIDDIHGAYKNYIQKTKFQIKCIGKRENVKGNLVFFLVVESKDLFNVRKNLQERYESKAQEMELETNFDYKKFWPHITVGFVGGDVHGVTKGEETCLKGVDLVLF